MSSLITSVTMTTVSQVAGIWVSHMIQEQLPRDARIKLVVRRLQTSYMGKAIFWPPCESVLLRHHWFGQLAKHASIPMALAAYVLYWACYLKANQRDLLFLIGFGCRIIISQWLNIPF